jgi:PAS domain S-box-containing protein
LAGALLLMGTQAWAVNPHTPISQYLIDFWQESTGLPQNNVKAILQTSDGYLWIGTKGGLARFDGVRFITYSDRRPGELAEGEVWGVVEEGGSLWIGTYGGGLTQLKDGVCTTVRAGPNALPSDFVTALVAAPDGGLWIGTEEGLCRYVQGRFSVYGPREGLPSKDIRALHVDAQGALWIGTPAGLARYQTGHFVSYAARFPGRLDTRVRAIAEHPATGVWIGTSAKGLLNLRGETLSEYTQKDGLPSDLVTALLVDAHSTLWVGTDQGLCRFADGRCERLVSDSGGPAPAGVPQAASFRNIQSLGDDGEGGLWIGTTLDGLARLRDRVFLHVRQAEGLLNEDVRSVLVDRNGVTWVGTAGGVARLEGGRARALTPAQGLVGNAVASVFEDREGAIWVGTSLGLSRVRGERIERMSAGGLDRTAIQNVVEAADGTLWIGTQQAGIARYRQGVVTHFGPNEGLSGRQVRATVFDASGRLWVGTKDDGLFQLEGDRFVPQPSSPAGRREAVHALLADGDVLWVATRHGLQRIKNGRVATVTAEQGLKSNFVYQFVDDGRGDLWLTYGSGIMRIAKRELNAVADGHASQLTCQAYGSQHGLQSTAMSLGRQNAAFRSQDGRLLFATGRGVAIVDPDHIPRNPRAPPVWVEEIRFDGQRYRPRPGAAFAAGRGRLEIRYTGLSFVSPDQVRFQRKLEGFDRDWIDAGTQRVAYYTNLPPRRYRFLVKACNSDGVWNEAGASYTFDLLPRWYQTTVAKLAWLVLAGLALGLGYRLRLRRLRTNERQLTLRVEARTRELEQAVERQREIAEQLNAEVLGRERVQQDLNRLNAELGERVAQRTTELAAANADLSAEKERLTVTLRSIGDGVIATDVRGTVVLLNRVAEELAGWPRDEAIGRAISEVFPVVDRWTHQPLPHPVEAVIRSERPQDLPGPVLLLARDGRELLVADSVAPIRDRESRVTGAVLVFRDVSEKVRTEEHLAKAGKMEALGVLAAGIAHDFNNLLAGLLGYIDLARKASPRDGPVQRRLSRALEVLDRARGLSNQLLTFTGGGKPVTAPTDIGALVREGARFALSGSNVTSECAIPHNLWPCQVDAGQIGQLIDNLLINARQAMPDGGRVDLQVENVTVDTDPILSPGRYVRLTIRDHGPGIPPEIRDRVFDPFFTTKPKGSGLGLATAHSIVERHGGHIDFESRSDGVAFHVLLPATQSAGRAAVAIKPAKSALKGRVLVMDDEVIVREVLHDALEALGLRAVEVADGAAAIAASQAALAEGDPFEIAVLDLTIAGGMGGVETLAALRERQPGLRAIASSGYSSDPVMADPQKYGFQGTLPKPYLIDDVSRALAALLPRPGG